MPKYEEGDKVKVASNNDNESYDDFRGKELLVVGVATSKADHRFYDEGMGGMALYDLQTMDGEDIGFSLYEYELEDE